jgi:hypothetical protein
LRAYNGAKATALANCIRVRRSSDNTEQDIPVTATGDLNTAAATTFASGSNLFVTKIYDQASGTADLIQATTARQPQLFLTGGPSAGKPYMACASSLLQTSATITRNQPLSMSCCFTRTGATTSFNFLMYLPSGNLELRSQNAANNIEFYAGSAQAAACADNTWHYVQAVYNNASGLIKVDTTTTNANAGGNNASGTVLRVMAQDSTPSTPLVGNAVEFRYDSAAIGATDLTNLASNVKTYWGY